MNFLGQLISLAFLLADGHQPYPGRADADNLLAEEISHYGELHEMMRLAGYIGADVE